MIKRAFLRGILAGALALGGIPAFGQYYDWGRSPAGIRWMQVQGPRGKVIFPDYYSSGAAQVLQVMDSVSATMGYGFRHAPLRVPTVLHTQNFEENGIVMWAPKRMELKTIAPRESYATPWLKQLVAHESRHTVQYGNLYKSWMPPLGWFIGQQAGLVSQLFVPLWMMEGDAVQIETQMSSFGRALQPSFTLEYRAYMAEGKKRYAVDKWFSGSYKNFIPDHYQLGYQLTAWSRERYGDDIWDRVIDYSVRHPYTILTTHWALKKYYKITVGDLFHETFADLKRYWDSLPPRANSARVIATPVTSYTVYEAPMICTDTTLVALKRDMDRPRRMVQVDPRSGEEKRLFYTGYVLTPPVLDDSVLYWSEYRSSLLWAERINARVCTYDLRTGRRTVLRDRKNALYPTPLTEGKLATVGYDYTGRYSVDLGEGVCHLLPEGVSVHGMAYDSVTATLALIVLEDRGMSICQMDLKSGRITPITQPSRVSLRNLQAGAGLLSFGSIASGFDEVHLLDLHSGVERRATTSRYGSFSPGRALPGGENLYLTTYTLDGYRISEQKMDTASMERVAYRELPQNVVNPPRRKWPVINLDTVQRVYTLDTTQVKKKPFRKGLHLFNVHSWTPWSFDPFNIAEEDRIDVGFGVTAMSQDLLSSTKGFLSYGYSGSSRIRGMIQYEGLAPKFEVSFDYGGHEQLVYGKRVPELLPPLKQRFLLDGAVSLPMQLSSGYHLRVLTPEVHISYQNSLLFNEEKEKYDRGFARGVASLSYVDNVRMATRDLQPRWGYALKSTLVGAPFRSDFGRILSLYGRLYTPGLLPHHGVMLRGVWQKQTLDTYNFYYKELFPRGANYNVSAERYGAFSADYRFPICYPDGGLNSLVYFNRIRLNLYYDYARYSRIVSFEEETEKHYPASVWSYGGEITFDMRFIRMPKNDTSIGIYLYKPSDQSGVVVGANLTLPL